MRAHSLGPLELAERKPIGWIAAEDRGFYTEPGISPKGIARALVTNVAAGSVQEGGSTLTQQLVKQTLLQKYGQDKVYTLEGARLVGYQNDYAAYVAYRMKDRPISLVITSDSVARPSGGEEIQARGLMFHYNAIDGLKVLTWSDRGLTYALVSDLEERGQQSCIVCHEGTKDRDLLEPLKPH